MSVYTYTHTHRVKKSIPSQHTPLSPTIEVSITVATVQKRFIKQLMGLEHLALYDYIRRNTHVHRVQSEKMI